MNRSNTAGIDESKAKPSALELSQPVASASPKLPGDALADRLESAVGAPMDLAAPSTKKTLEA
ncbi:MAG: hypothetical protein KIT25_10995 [Enhydrobacter sp.]|nr:MAG: hypothetical protein KIT25_10995 [Enhydrobacter sp.]